MFEKLGVEVSLEADLEDRFHLSPFTAIPGPNARLQRDFDGWVEICPFRPKGTKVPCPASETPLDTSCEPLSAHSADSTLSPQFSHL